MSGKVMKEKTVSTQETNSARRREIQVREGINTLYISNRPGRRRDKAILREGNKERRVNNWTKTRKRERSQ